MERKFSFGWWTTGRDKAAVNLFKAALTAIDNGIIAGDFAYLFMSKRREETPYCAEISELAQKRGIPVLELSATSFMPDLRKGDREKWRALYHEKIYELVRGFSCPLAVLAGYMWVLSPEICSKIAAINLHPALPGGPAGTWQEVIWQLLQTRAQKTGAMMHLVTPELDKGPPITFFSFPIVGPEWQNLWDEFFRLENELGFKGVMEEQGENLPLFKRIRAEGEKRELPLIVQTLRAFSLGRLKAEAGGVLDESGSVLKEPVDLTTFVEEQIRTS